MFVDKEFVLKSLDTSDPQYEDWLIDINTAPNSTIFEVVIDDAVTAEYIDNGGVIHIFKLDYEYDTPSNVPPRLEINKLERSIEQSLNENDEFGLNKNEIKRSIVPYMLFFVLSTSTVFIFLYLWLKLKSI